MQYQYDVFENFQIDFYFDLRHTCKSLPTATTITARAKKLHHDQNSIFIFLKNY